MTTTTTVAPSPLRVREPYWRYVFDADLLSSRTDTPGLLSAFEDKTRQHDDLDEDARAAHVDLVGLSYRTLPAW